MTTCCRGSVFSRLCESDGPSILVMDARPVSRGRTRIVEDDGKFPLEWPVDYSQCDTCEPFEKDETGDVKAKFEDMAKWFLWQWTKRMFGTTTSWLRPDRHCDREPTYSRVPEELVYPLYCGRCRACGCSCGRLTSLWVSYPLVSVEKIMVGGVELDRSAYRLEGTHRIVRTDGGVWPSWQDTSVDVDNESSWGIQAVVGHPVPTGGRIAAGVLACELAKAACDDKSCRLPKRISSITRQGVAMTMLDDFEGLDEGRTGIWLIDSWITSFIKPPATASVVSPDAWLAGRRNTMVKGQYR